MGRPSPAQKRAKRQRQKIRRKLAFTDKIAEKETTCSCTPFGEPNESMNLEDDQDPRESNLRMGDIDTDVVKMVVYDDYRQNDGESYTLGICSSAEKRL